MGNANKKKPRKSLLSKLGFDGPIEETPNKALLDKLGFTDDDSIDTSSQYVNPGLKETLQRVEAERGTIRNPFVTEPTKTVSTKVALPQERKPAPPFSWKQLLYSDDNKPANAEIQINTRQAVNDIYKPWGQVVNVMNAKRAQPDWKENEAIAKEIYNDTFDEFVSDASANKLPFKTNYMNYNYDDVLEYNKRLSDNLPNKHKTTITTNLNGNPLLSKIASGAFSPLANTIYLKPDRANVTTTLHETAHANQAPLSLILSGTNNSIGLIPHSAMTPELHADAAAINQLAALQLRKPIISSKDADYILDNHVVPFMGEFKDSPLIKKYVSRHKNDKNAFRKAIRALILTTAKNDNQSPIQNNSLIDNGWEVS